MAYGTTSRKIALVGIGKIARDQHLPALQASDDWDLAATVSRSGAIEGVEASEQRIVDEILIATDGTVSTFSHPLNLTPPSDVRGTYEWSPNLADWYSSGNGPGGNPIVTMVPNTVGTTTTVTATASQALARIFLRVRVNQN